MSDTTSSLIEAAILTSQEPLTNKALCALFEPPLSTQQLNEALNSLYIRWQDRSLVLCDTTQGWRFQVKAEAFSALSRLNPEKPPKYSRAVLETLAIIAYQQPVTRGDIEAIRGVSVSSNVMQTLNERGWIEVIGQKEVVGRPSLWATTDQFLLDLNLNSLEELPPLTELGQLVVPELNQEPAAIDAAEE
ncbi:SMC-Scp complex subunit ScpB [Neisseria sp. Ec49-e6-T10]|uniref:SMC-Scp complex subunit ScpB n=1 Tax=Neisseria sp. Ec49-e6-T10 TaxID=3140744 RepID=UPI003EBE2549